MKWANMGIGLLSKFEKKHAIEKLILFIKEN